MENRESAFTSEPNLVGDDYRPISLLAVAALIVGILSTVSLLNIYFVFVPILGAIIAVIALIRVALSGNRVTGIQPAAVGLAICLFSGSWAASQHVVDNSLVFHQAQEHSMSWLSLLKDQKIYHAYELKLPYGKRNLPGVDLVEVYKERGEGFFADEEMAEEMGMSITEMSLSKEGVVFSSFVRSEPFRSIYRKAKNGEFEFLRNLEVRRNGHTTYTAQLYRLTYVDDRDESNKIDFVLRMKRVYDPKLGVYHWNVGDVLPPNAS